MTVTIDIDTFEVDAFVAVLRGVEGKLPGVIAPVMKRAAQNIKNDLQADFKSSRYAGFRQIANRISYDNITGNQYGWRTTVGIDKGGAGNLGNLAVFGTYKGGGTHKHPTFHAEREMPEFEAQVLKAVEGLI